jgi:hypothetical protein
MTETDVASIDQCREIDESLARSNELENFHLVF